MEHSSIFLGLTGERSRRETAPTHVGSRRLGPHLEEAVLAAYIARQVDPTRRAAYATHLADCPECRRRFARVKVLTEVLREAPSDEPDDLAWRRLRDRVKAQLEQEARELPSTQDVHVGRRWATAGLAAVVLVALAAALAPSTHTKRGEWDRAAERPTERSDQVTLEPSTSSAPGHVLSSGSTHLDATLATGLRLRLAPNSRVASLGSRNDEEVLALDAGEVDVRAPMNQSVTPRVRLTTPGFELRGTSRAFRVGYWSDRFSVSVQEGELRAEGGPFSSGEAIAAGVERSGRLDALALEPRPKTPTPSAKPSVRSPPAPPVEREAKTKAPVLAAPEPGSAPPSRPAAPTGVEASRMRVDQVRTEVEVVAPPDHPARSALRRAKAAYYHARNLEEAARWAKHAVRLGAGRSEAREGNRLLCDVHVAQKRPKDAVRACRAALEGASGEAQRTLHYTIATLFRTQLHDCGSAIEHYNRVLIFGAKTILDDDVRLFRATCFLALGDREGAARDVRELEARSGWLARPEELERLKKQLSEQ